jgi:hypothetical protein
MMHNAERFAFTAGHSELGEASLLPYLPLTLAYQGRSVAGMGLLDTGATVNVLPYNIGIELGAVWEQQAASIRLSGNLAQFEARPLIVSALVGRFDPVRLAFAWTRADHIPLILGQVNFFIEFDVCFYRSQQVFEIHPKATP